MEVAEMEVAVEAAVVKYSLMFVCIDTPSINLGSVISKAKVIPIQ